VKRKEIDRRVGRYQILENGNPNRPFRPRSRSVADTDQPLPRFMSTGKDCQILPYSTCSLRSARPIILENTAYGGV